RTSTTPGMGAAPLARKATMMGLGVAGPSSRPPAPAAQPSAGRHGAEAPTSTPPTPATTSVAPAQPPRPGPASPPPMFPKTDVPKDTGPRQEQTVMKQAAEL